MTRHTSFSQSASAFCLRRISTSTWLRACLSLTSSAPLSVSALVSTSLHEPSSSCVLSHLRRQSSKFWTIWIKPGRRVGGGVYSKSRDCRLGWNLQRVLNKGQNTQRTIKYLLGSMFSLRRSTCVLSLSYMFWRVTTVFSMLPLLGRTLSGASCVHYNSRDGSNGPDQNIS